MERLIAGGLPPVVDSVVLRSGAALATVVGVLVEVPVMLSVYHACVATRHWFAEAPSVYV